MTGAEKTKAAPDSTGAASEITKRNYPANSATAQRQRILDWFAINPRLFTEQARRELDIMSPAARVMELKRLDHLVVTHWDLYPTACGKLHRMACYVYLGKSNEQEEQ